MLIPVTNINSKQVMGIAAATIWVVERNVQNMLTTRLVTTMNSREGLVTYEIMETPEEVIAMVAQAAGKAVPTLNAQPATEVVGKVS